MPVTSALKRSVMRNAVAFSFSMHFLGWPDTGGLVDRKAFRGLCQDMDELHRQWDSELLIDREIIGVLYGAEREAAYRAAGFRHTGASRRKTAYFEYLWREILDRFTGILYPGGPWSEDADAARLPPPPEETLDDLLAFGERLFPSETDWQRVEAQADAEIDTSDIAPLTVADFARARVRAPRASVAVMVRLDPDVLAWYQALGKGWEQRMSTALRIYADAHRAED